MRLTILHQDCHLGWELTALLCSCGLRGGGTRGGCSWAVGAPVFPFLLVRGAHSPFPITPPTARLSLLTCLSLSILTGSFPAWPLYVGVQLQCRGQCVPVHGCVHPLGVQPCRDLHLEMWVLGPASVTGARLVPGWTGARPCPSGGFLLPLLLWRFGRDAQWSQGLPLEPLVAGGPASQCCPHLSLPSSCLFPAPPGMGSEKGKGPWPQRGLPSGPHEKTLSKDKASDRS